ncbi:unnamed protein product [Ascophyllum nodosum]
MRTSRTARRRMRTSRVLERQHRRRNTRAKEGGGLSRSMLWACVLLVCAGVGIVAQVLTTRKSHVPQSEGGIPWFKAHGELDLFHAVHSGSGRTPDGVPGNGGGGTGEPKFEGNDIDGWKERSGGVGLEGARRDPADAVELRYAAGLDGAGPIETFLAEGKKLPVVLLTCNRATLLSETIKSLRQVRGMDMGRVLVLQDGSDSEVAAVVKREGLYLMQHIAAPGLRGGPRAGEGATRIAMHYKFSLNHVFEREPEAPAVIIVEDDLLLSPDFLEYFEANAPILERDADTLVLSAWNDNGYRGRVSDKSELQRTLYFPGLGWLLLSLPPIFLSKKIPLRPRWPQEHWDHWLRDSKQHKGRECVFPEVPRTYHNGVKGTFMDQKMHDKLFKDIDYNTDSSFRWRPSSSTEDRCCAGWDPPPYAKAMLDNYERRVQARIRAARHINDLDDLPRDSTDGRGQQRSGGEEIVFWYSLPQTEESQFGRGRMSQGPPFKPLSEFFGIWHEYRRTEHNGMHSFRYGGDSHVMLVNADKSLYNSLRPAGLLPATMEHLRGFGLGHRDGEEEGQRRKLQAVPGDEPDVSCDDICANKGMHCVESGFGRINSCTVLIETFSCNKCSESYGPDQPCYVEEYAPVANFPGQCLVSSNPSGSGCSAKHELTRRLCPCEPSMSR